LENVAKNTNIILPPVFMQTVTDAIKRDGIAMARVPAKLEMELAQYGGSTAIEILEFQASCFPDLSSWRIFEVIIMSVVQRLKSRLQLAESIVRERQQVLSIYQRSDPMHSVDCKTELNGFRDILNILLRRVWTCFMEINVFYSTLLQFRIVICSRL
jgi:hypothetical protein